MKKIIAVAIEEIMLILYLLIIGILFSERISSPDALWIVGLIKGTAIVLAKTVEAIIDDKLIKNTCERRRPRLLQIWAIRFSLISLIFFLAFNALDYFGIITTTYRVLVMFSLCAAAFHSNISLFLDNLTGANRETFEGR